MPFRQENRLNDLKYNDNRYLRASGPTQTVSTTIIFEGTQGLTHEQLSNMPDTTGVVIDHDNRLVAKVQTTTPTVPTTPFKGQLWYNPSQGLTGYYGETGLQGVTGLQGITGLQGLTGLVGVTGLQGIQGQTGVQGQTGPQGQTGVAGTNGNQGVTGLQGLTGLQGIQGIQGITGLRGMTGIQGTTGVQGIQGTTGVHGLIGATGVQGVTGLRGTTGIQGTTGVQGIQGIQGVTGLIGQTGSQGITGLRGMTGLQGQTGVQGITGLRGTTGIQGIQGVTGPQGTPPADVVTANPELTDHYVPKCGGANTLLDSVIHEEGSQLLITNTANIYTNASQNLGVQDNTAQATGTGGGITFEGLYDASNYVIFAGIKAYKTSATSGNTSGQLHLQTRLHGGQPTTRMIIDENGYISIGATSAEKSAPLDIKFGGLDLLIGADASATTRTDSTLKSGKIALFHYTNADTPACIINAYSNIISNAILIGGGTSSLNAATEIYFYTAADNSTTTGTLRMSIVADGTVSIKTCANAGTNTGKNLVLDSSYNIDYRTNAELAADIGADVVTVDQDVTIYLHDNNGQIASGTGRIIVTNKTCTICIPSLRATSTATNTHIVVDYSLPTMEHSSTFFTVPLHQNGIYVAGMASYVGSGEFYLRDYSGTDLGIGTDRGIAACNIRYIIQ